MWWRTCGGGRKRCFRLWGLGEDYTLLVGATTEGEDEARLPPAPQTFATKQLPRQHPPFASAAP